MHFGVRFSFIHAFDDEATMQRDLNSLCNASLSHLAAPNTIKGLSFALKQKETQTFSCPVLFKDISFLPVASTIVDDVISAQTAVSSMARQECFVLQLKLLYPYVRKVIMIMWTKYHHQKTLLKIQW